MEIKQSISDEPIKECPKCGAEALERLVSQSSFALKGGGWYADGYGTAKSDSAASSSDAGDKKDKKSDAKTETKASDSSTKAETKTKSPDKKAS